MINRVFISLLTAFFCTQLIANDSQELASLVEQSKKDYPACKTTYDALKKIAQTDEAGENYKSRAVALKVLEALETHVATPDYSKKISTLVAAKGTSITEDDVEALWSQKCGSLIFYYSNLRRLILTTKSLGFSPSEKRRVVDETLKHLKEETSAPTFLIGSLVEVALAKLLVEEKLIELPGESSKKLADLQQRGNAFRDEMRKNSTPPPSPTKKDQAFKDFPVDYRRREVDQTKKEIAFCEASRKEMIQIISQIRTKEEVRK